MEFPAVLRACPNLSRAEILSGVAPANQTKGRNEKFMKFTLFCEFGCFSLEKQAQFTSNFGSNLSLREVHEPTFFWFGLPERLLILGGGGLFPPSNEGGGTKTIVGKGKWGHLLQKGPKTFCHGSMSYRQYF